MLLERVVTHSPTIPFNRNSNSSNPEDAENGLAPRLGSEEVESPLLSLRRPSFSRWPEQSVLGQQTLVSGHLEFSLKTTALKPHARVATLGPYKCYVATPLTHLYKFKARMRLQSCGLLRMCGSRKIYVNSGG